MAPEKAEEKNDDMELKIIDLEHQVAVLSADKDHLANNNKVEIAYYTVVCRKITDAYGMSCAVLHASLPIDCSFVSWSKTESEEYKS